MSIVDEITELLKQKQQIDGQQQGIANYDGWAIEALVLLLRAALEQEMQRERNNA
jgi:hypothetical protein